MPVNRVGKDKFAFVARLTFVLAATLGLVLTSASAARAHKVYLYAWVEGGMVHTESYFGSKKKVKEGLILVYDFAGNKLLEGRTNKHGEFSFRPPQKTDLRIVCEGSMGHKAEYILKAEDFSDILGGHMEPNKSEETEMRSSSSVSVNTEQIRTIVEQALDTRLKPIIRELADIRKEEGPGLTEVMGGVGYIFGIMGVVMYFRSRQKK
jgi:nickel transport protein